MLTPNRQSIALSIRYDQYWPIFGKIMGILKQIDAWLQDCAAAPTHFDIPSNIFGAI